MNPSKRASQEIYTIFIYVFKCFMHFNVWCNKDLCGTNLCDQHLTHIICINKTRAEKCRFTVAGNGPEDEAIAGHMYLHVLQGWIQAFY